mgnify:CR=1 FL=1
MTDHDIGDTLAPKSDQLDAVDLISGPRVFSITECVTRKGEDQPTTIKLAEFPRPWRPGKNMRRVLAFCWGGKGSLYAGRRVLLYCDPNVVYGGEKVGGIRIRALSHIDGPMDAPIIPTRGKGGIWHVEPLPDEPTVTTGPTAEQVDACTDVDVLSAMWKVSGPEMRARIEARATALKAQAAADGPMVTRPESEGSDPWAQSGESLLDQGAGS